MKKTASLRVALSISPIFSESQRATFVADFDHIVKEADLRSPVAAFIKTIAPDVLTMATLSATSGILGYLAAKHKYDQSKENMDRSYNQLLAQHPFSGDTPGFHQRFSELSLIAPTIASNPSLASKVLETRLQNGFDLDDVHKLSAIEFHTSNSVSGAPTPSAAGRAQALERLKQTADMFTPTLVHAGREAKKAYKVDKVLSAAAASPEFMEHVKANLDAHFQRKREARMMNKQSNAEPEMKVSEECLGRMLADTHVMCKTAAFGLQSIGSTIAAHKGAVLDFVTPSKGVMKEYFHMMAIPLAIGGGIALLNKVMKQKETNQMKAQADAVFGRLKVQSETVKENPELAFEAFDALRSFAPMLATKPLVARTFVEHVIDTGGRGLTPEAAQQLANTQSVINTISEHGSSSFIGGLKEPMSLFTHSIGRGKSGEKGGK